MIEKTKEEIVREIRKMILQVVNNSSEQWVYAGYVFTARNGSTEMIDFYFDQKNKRGFLEDRDWFKSLRNNFKALCNLKEIKKDNSWIKCKAVLHKDGAFKVLFEYNDSSRWSISPTNVSQAYKILISDILP